MFSQALLSEGVKYKLKKCKNKSYKELLDK